MGSDVIIIGAGGQGRVVADIAVCRGDNVLGFLDDKAALGSKILGFPVLGKISDYKNFSDAHFNIAIGNSHIRSQVAEMLNGVKWYTAIHPTAVISSLGTSIEEGSAVMANAVINPNAKIGRHCIINSGSIIEHDNIIGDFCHISVGARLGGTVSIHEHTWIGLGACVKNNISICKDCMIGVGAVVVKDIYQSGTYIGVPAVKLQKE